MLQLLFHLVLLTLQFIASMTQVDVEGDGEDRISDLPRNVIDGIINLLPVHDAARTSILSRKWRYTWAMFPILVLDKHFCNKLAVKSQSDLKETVDEIMLQHIGDIVKFVLDVSEGNLSSYAHIDRWMLYVTRNGVKELTLDISNNTTYKLPSYIFNCATVLTHLKLFNCVFKPPTSFLGFQKLTNLYLEKITFVPTSEFCVIKVPLLVRLTLKYCLGTQYLNMVSPQLETLVFRGRHHLELNCFTNCKYLRKLVLIGRLVDNKKYVKRSTLEKLLRLPTLEILQLNLSYLELLIADTVPNALPVVLGCVRDLSLIIDFGKLDQISLALQLIRGSSNLSRLDVWVCSSNNGEGALSYLDMAAFLDRRPLNNLKYVNMYWFKGSKTELLLVKLLFARAPSLVRMSIKPERDIGTREERDVTTELMRFPRASPNAELFYLPIAD